MEVKLYILYFCSIFVFSLVVLLNLFKPARTKREENYKFLKIKEDIQKYKIQGFLLIFLLISGSFLLEEKFVNQSMIVGLIAFFARKGFVK